MQFVSSIIFIHSLPLNTADREIAIRSKFFCREEKCELVKKEREREESERENRGRKEKRERERARKKEGVGERERERE